MEFLLMLSDRRRNYTCLLSKLVIYLLAAYLNIS